MSSNACLQHCEQLTRRAIRERHGTCLADSQDCRKYREQRPEDNNRLAIKETLGGLFDVDHVADKIDLVSLVEAIHADDGERIDTLVREVVPPVDWIELDDIGFGNDWGGTKVAIVCAVNHPQLRTTVGLVIGTGGTKLTLGRIERQATFTGYGSGKLQADCVVARNLSNSPNHVV